MVSGSQLQVAKLAQMCPAAPCGGLRRRMEHLGAPCSTKCPFKTNSPSFYVRLKKRQKCLRIRRPGFRPESRGPPGALGGLIKKFNISYHVQIIVDCCC